MVRPFARRGVATVALALAGVLATASLGGAAAPFPGLGDHRQTAINEGLNPGSWVAAAQTGMSEVDKAAQAVRIPLQAVSGFTSAIITFYPPDDPLGRTDNYTFRNMIDFVSPPGHEQPYGHLVPLEVRTVAFGSIPVEATVQVSQQFDENGLPIPFVFETPEDRWNGTELREFKDTVISERVTLSVLDLKVDGVEIGLSGYCSTREPAQLDLVGKGGFTVGWEGDFKVINDVPADTYFTAARGGALKGTIDVPEFSGCLTRSGEDVSALLTGTVSGNDNPIELRAAVAFCNPPAPPAPGENRVESILGKCTFNQFVPVPGELPYPGRKE